MTPEERQERIDAFRARRGPSPGDVLKTAGSKAWGYLNRALETTGLGIGTTVSRSPYGQALRKGMPEGMWLRPGDADAAEDAFRAFHEQRKQGDWDAGIKAAQEELDAGPGFWGASEIAGEAVAPAGLWKIGTRLIRSADKFGDFAGAARLAGKGLQLPWVAEEAAGRAIAAPVVGAFRGARGLLRRGPVDEYLDEGIVPPSAAPVTRTPESAYDEFTEITARREIPSPELQQYLEDNRPAVQAVMRERLAAAADVEPGVKPEPTITPTTAPPTAADVGERMSELEEGIADLTAQIDDLNRVISPEKTRITISKSGKEYKVAKTPLLSRLGQLSKRELRDFAKEVDRDPTIPDWYEDLDSQELAARLRSRRYVPGKSIGDMQSERKALRSELKSLEAERASAKADAPGAPPLLQSVATEGRETRYMVNRKDVPKSVYDKARRESRRKVTDGETPPPPIEKTPSGARFYGNNPGPVNQLQDVGYAISRAGQGRWGRAIANWPGARVLFKRINPSAVDATATGKAFVGRTILIEEGKQKASQAFAHLRRLGTQERVFGATDDSGFLLTPRLKGLALNDIRSKHARYRDVLTKEQNEWIEAADELERSKLSFLKINGINIKELDFSPGGQYAGRRMWGIRNEATGELESIAVTRPGLKQKTASEKHRYFPSIQAAQAQAGRDNKKYVYLAEDEALLFNLRDAYHRVADKRFSEWAIDNIDELQIGRKKRGAYKLVASRPDDLKDAYFTGEQADDLGKAFEKELIKMIGQPASGLTSAITKANALGRFMTLNGDASPFLIQLLFLSTFSPRVWAKSMKAFIETLFSTRYHSNLVNKNRDLLARHPNLLTSLNGTEMTEALQQGGFLTSRVGSWVGGRYIARTLDPFGRAFGASMDDAGINLAKGLEQRALLPDRGPYDSARAIQGAPNAYTAADFDPVKMADVDDFINEMRGISNSARIGVTAQQQFLETSTLLAPRYNRAIASLLYDAGRGVVETAAVVPGVTTLTKGAIAPSLRGDLGREALGKSVLGLTSIASAIALAFYMMEQKKNNKPYDMEEAVSYVQAHINPTSQKFFEWEVGGVNIGPGSKVRSLIGFAAKSLDDPSSFQGIATRFARGQGSPVVGAAWNALTGFGYMGEPTPIGYGATGQIQYWDDYNDKPWPAKGLIAAENQIFPHLVPVWLQGMLMSNATAETSVLDKATMGLGEFFGLRTRPLNRTQLAVEVAKEEGLVSNFEEYDALSSHSKQRFEGIIDERLGPRDYRGKEGFLYEKKDKTNEEFITNLKTMAVDVNAGIVDGDFDTKGFNPEAARREFLEHRNKRNLEVVNINKDLYGEDVEEEPEENTREHDLWGYYQIYEGLDELPDEEKFELIAERDAAYWSDLNRDAIFDGERVTGFERVEYVLDSVRVIEEKYPKGIKRMVHAMRYASSVQQDIHGSEKTYWDLDTHPLFIEEIQYRTNVSASEIKRFLERPWRAQKALAEYEKGTPEARMDEAITASKQKGVLRQLRNEFIKQAPKEWLLGMLYAGYKFTGSDRVKEEIKQQMLDGSKMPEVDFKDLLTMSLAG